MAALEGLGFDKLMETLASALRDQKERHQGGSKWIGTAGTSPFGAYGYNPEGVRIGQEESRHQRAVKVWDKREFKTSMTKSDSDAQHQDRFATPAPMGARRRTAGTRSAGHNPHDSAQGLSRLEAGARTPQHGEGAGFLRCRRIDGSVRAHLRGAVLRGALRVQAHGAFLLPQLPIRRSVDGQSPPPRTNGSRRGTFCAPTAPTTRSSLSVMRR